MKRYPIPKTETQTRKARLRALLGVYGVIDLHFNRQKVRGRDGKKGIALRMNYRCSPKLRNPITRGWVKQIAKGLFHLSQEFGSWGEKK